MLCPDALKVTDALGFYSTIRFHGYTFELLGFETAAGEFIDS